MQTRTVTLGVFEWDAVKDAANQMAHGVAFQVAVEAFADPQALLLPDLQHSTAGEVREFLVGQVGDRVLTVRFTRRSGRMRIF